MAITVDYSSKPYLITIPQSDCTLVSGTRYEITVDEMWILFRDYADGPIGSAYVITYRRIQATASTPPITEINDPTYSCEFEDGAWSVDIIDGNSNFRDVEAKNTVSVGTNNTTGYSIVPVGSGLSAAEAAQLLLLYQDRGFDAGNIVTVDETAGTITVAGIIRTWAGTVIKTLTRTP